MRIFEGNRVHHIPSVPIGQGDIQYEKTGAIVRLEMADRRRDARGVSGPFEFLDVFNDLFDHSYHHEVILNYIDGLHGLLPISPFEGGVF